MPSLAWALSHHSQQQTAEDRPCRAAPSSLTPVAVATLFAAAGVVCHLKPGDAIYGRCACCFSSILWAILSIQRGPSLVSFVFLTITCLKAVPAGICSSFYCTQYSGYTFAIKIHLWALHLYSHINIVHVEVI